MSRAVSPPPRASHRALSRAAATVALTTFLALGSSVSHASWTAVDDTQPATVTTGTMAMSSAGLAGLAITYSATDQVVINPVTVSNTGSVPLELGSIGVTADASSDTLRANVTLVTWVKPAEGCLAPAPAGTLLSSSSIPLPGSVSVPAGGTAELCAATKLTGAVEGLASASMSLTLTVNASGGGTWATQASETLTQSVAGASLPAPTGLTCTPKAFSGFSFVVITWTAPTGSPSPVAGYNIYIDGFELGYMTGTSMNVMEEVGEYKIGVNNGDPFVASASMSAKPNADVTVRTVFQDASVSVDSTLVPIVVGAVGSDPAGVACG